jgi:hypothetical protein
VTSEECFDCTGLCKACINGFTGSDVEHGWGKLKNMLLSVRYQDGVILHRNTWAPVAKIVGSGCVEGADDCLFFCQIAGPTGTVLHQLEIFIPFTNNLWLPSTFVEIMDRYKANWTAK